MIRVKDLCYTYQNSNHGLSNINLNIQNREFIALVGSNGSGKTTLARCLNGLLLPNSGRVVVDDMDTCNRDQIYQIRRKVGMVFQNPDNQIVSATVEREIAFGLENLGVPPLEMKARVERMLLQFDLQHLRKKSPHYLSGGEKQRLALAGIMAMQPSYLILDEPTSLLDPRARKEILNTLEKMRQKMAVILITQFPQEALMADRLVVMHNGTLFSDDKPSEFFSRFDSIAQLGLEPPMRLKIERELRLAGFLPENDQSPGL